MFLFIVKIYCILQLSTFNSFAIILMPNNVSLRESSPHPRFHEFDHYQTDRCHLTCRLLLLKISCTVHTQQTLGRAFSPYGSHHKFKASVAVSKKFYVYSLLSSFNRHDCRKLKNHLYRNFYYLMLCQYNRSWFDMQLVEGSVVTSVCILW